MLYRGVIKSNYFKNYSNNADNSMHLIYIKFNYIVSPFWAFLHSYVTRNHIKFSPCKPVQFRNKTIIIRIGCSKKFDGYSLVLKSKIL